MTTNGNEERPLPDGWEWTTIGEVAQVNYRDPVIRELPDDLEVTFVPMAAVDEVDGKITDPQIKPLKITRKGYTPFSEGDVLFAKITPCMENGKAAIARNLKNGRGFGSTEFHVMKPGKKVLAEWLFYFVRQTSFRDDAKANFSGTAGQLRVKKNFIIDYSLPLSPLWMQEQIIAEIEKQFTRLDQAVASLRRLQEKLARYKASVLKAACEGRLVAQDENDEPASELLARVLAERRAQWEAVNPKKKYQEPAGVDTAELPELPEGWVWASVEQLGEVRLGRQRSPKNHQGPNMRPYLRAANATWDGVDLTDVMEMNFSPRELEIYRLQIGDILLAEASGSANEVGKPFIWNGQIPNCCFQNTLIRVRLSNIPPEYLHLHFLKDAQTGRFGRIAKGVGIHHLGADRLSNMSVAIPPQAEQKRIIAEVERRLSVVAATEQAITDNLGRAERLRQSILHRAFTGRLV